MEKEKEQEIDNLRNESIEEYRKSARLRHLKYSTTKSNNDSTSVSSVPEIITTPVSNNDNIEKTAIVNTIDKIELNTPEIINNTNQFQNNLEKMESSNNNIENYNDFKSNISKQTEIIESPVQNSWNSVVNATGKLFSSAMGYFWGSNNTTTSVTHNTRKNSNPEDEEFILLQSQKEEELQNDEAYARALQEQLEKEEDENLKRLETDEHAATKLQEELNTLPPEIPEITDVFEDTAEDRASRLLRRFGKNLMYTSSTPSGVIGAVLITALEESISPVSVIQHPMRSRRIRRSNVGLYNIIDEPEMSYEALSNLKPVPKGAAKLDVLPTRIHKGESLPAGCTECSICLCSYSAGEELRTLPCLHFFHKKCIDLWLQDHRQCPICKFELE